MSTFAITSAAPFGSVFARLTEVPARIGQYRLYRKTLAELSALSPEQLDDLGLTPDTLKRIARQATYDMR